MQVWHAIVIVLMIAIVCAASVLTHKRRAEAAVAEAEADAQDLVRLMDELTKKSSNETERWRRKLNGE